MKAARVSNIRSSSNEGSTRVKNPKFVQRRERGVQKSNVLGTKRFSFSFMRLNNAIET